MRGWILPERAGGAPHCRCDPVSCPVLGCGSARAGHCVCSLCSAQGGHRDPVCPQTGTDIPPLDGEDQEKLALWGVSGKAAPLAVPSVWAHPSPPLPQFPSCSASRASPFFFRGLPAASCPECSSCSPRGLPWASLSSQVEREGLSHPHIHLGECWYLGNAGLPGASLSVPLGTQVCWVSWQTLTQPALCRSLTCSPKGTESPWLEQGDPQTGTSSWGRVGGSS